MRKVLTSLVVLVLLVVVAMLVIPECDVYLDCCDKCVAACVTPACKKELGTYSCAHRCRQACSNSCSDKDDQ